MPPTLSQFARSLIAETAFDVLAKAHRLKASGKYVIELQIGDSSFPTPGHARAAGVRAIQEHQSHYCPSLGLPAFREVLANNYAWEFGVPVTAEDRKSVV